ncbi:D-methionine transport system substrate-binding protein [Enterococcus sp. PF1-24]|uniref:MetQ/NlpA family ABC transporter substrate-binding protein n=1 Tax=unclassified Enterococcus TaxID=2608891 RepID=UPI0024742B29|nr:MULTISPECIES: MetQ/NlpA family ABC transporter substrate-binding protein [unclassified Enterococcus]MDH6365372.1 D-methionine transport system substrate-binding protein [Enterococcus sp. PFB1-1]MDH6402473.1 D-methionine transport system substrate-binding protein [Enterococcus sp. PF1-24]
MKKKLLSLLAVSALTVSLAACGSSSDKKDAASSDESTTLKIGASSSPHSEILEQAKPLLKEQGIDLEITVIDDYNIPNRSLADGDIDANYFQHQPYLDQQIADYDYDITSVDTIHLEPMGLYSQRIDDIKDLKDGATVIASNSVSDWGRILQMFVAADLITLKDGVDIKTATFEDIDENKKNLTFQHEIDPAILTQAYQNDEADLIAINANWAYGAELNPVKDAVVLESDSSPYGNIVVVRKGDEEDERIQKLLDVLHSEEIQDWILEQWGGSVKPVEKK